jgi:hypothetical protein
MPRPHFRQLCSQVGHDSGGKIGHNTLQSKQKEMRSGLGGPEGGGDSTMVHGKTQAAEREPARPPAPPAPLSEVALTGIYEISKILTAPARLETTLSNVVNLLSSFMQMRQWRHLAVGGRGDSRHHGRRRVE